LLGGIAKQFRGVTIKLGSRELKISRSDVGWEVSAHDAPSTITGVEPETKGEETCPKLK